MLISQKVTQTSQNAQDRWKSLWKIKAPPKALNLMWRILSKCLPTKVQLQQKLVQIDGTCDVCRLGTESTMHIFFQCLFVAECWRILMPNMSTDPSREFMNWVDECLLKESADKRAMMVMLCWTIWRSRNDVVWNHKYSKPERIVAVTTYYLSQWKITQTKFFTVPLQPVQQGDEALKWVKPQ